MLLVRRLDHGIWSRRVPMKPAGGVGGEGGTSTATARQRCNVSWGAEIGAQVGLRWEGGMVRGSTFDVQRQLQALQGIAPEGKALQLHIP